MCGIFAILYSENQIDRVLIIIEKIQSSLIRRGHDHVCIEHHKIGDTDWCVGVIGCVLHLRGLITPQPVYCKGSWLLWNGEVYDGHVFKDTAGSSVGDCNDTQVMLKALSSAAESTDGILKVFSGIHGPWSMIYYQEESRTVWFGRDVLGRRSLLWHVCKDFIVVSSVAVPSMSICFDEVPAIGIYRISLPSIIVPLSKEMLDCYAWRFEDSMTPFLLTAAAENDIPDAATMIWDKKSFLKVPFQQLNMNLPDIIVGIAGKDIKLMEDCTLKALALLENAVRKRVHDSWKGKENIGILFSGGLDSVVLAALTDRCLEANKEIDLINVAFSLNKQDNYDVPDRVAAIQSLKELNPNRKWNLILVNVDAAELTQYREQCIHPLIYPLDTVMDDSIGCALWFAARGKGVLYNTTAVATTPATASNDTTHYETNSKILLVGMGADEQFGGYGRHRTAFVKGGWPSVLAEVKRDICRISSRNLGRDDRCISDHHREARYPYLDEVFVDYISSLPIWMKTDYSLERGLGEKILLRKMAAVLGCMKTAEMPKRAIQFGTRIAKISGTGGQRSAGLKHF